ncbi:MAG: General secretion pathway protein D [uncultured Sulfurovum sp.]|uniref:General secretion pathway protein D n=1 Tax=uncultured Sulfurovum sp. TaxID=269237 RepID=A0A6S6TUD0_9BACT|nr:MAG: General secretion pathway protein D [uncultured Sulfurovum sp.]
MNKISSIFICVFICVGITGCSIIDSNNRPNTKQYVLNDIDDKLSFENKEVSYVEDSLTEDMVEDLSSYVIPSTKDNVQEITNIKSLKTGQKVFNSDLMVVKKHFDTKKVKLSIEEMPLNKFLHLVFSKVLKVDYVLDKNVQKSVEPVSINIKEKISKKKLFSIVSNILQEFKIVMDVEGDIFYIKKSSKQLSESVHKVYFGTTLPKGLNDDDIIYMMRPFYYNKQITKHNLFIKEYFLSKNSDLRIDDYENVIKLRDKVKNIKKALEFYDFIDQPSMRNKQMKLVRMQNMDVEEFLTQLKPILDNYGILVASSPKSAGVQLVPIKQINSFLLLSDKTSWIETVLLWKSKLDIVEKNTSEDLEFFVYKPLNRKAEELVTVIKSFSHLYGVNGSASSSSSNTNNNSVGTRSNNVENPEQIKESVISSTRMGGNAEKLEEKTTVVLDKERNNIIIHATKKHYLDLKKMLENLDTLPKQVLIEVTIADISLTESLKFGFQWFLEKSGYNVTGLDGQGSTGAAGLLANMFSVSKGLSAVFSAAETKDYVNILSNPKLLVLNNHSASINVGNRVPILTSQATSSEVAGIIQSISYQETGISLSVKPIINSDGYLTLNITQNVSSAKQNTISSISSPVIFNRALQTDVVLKSGETVVLGGLISEDKTKNDVKVPFLGDVPILGKLFSNAGDTVEKSELVILIKPTIIRNNSDAKVVTEALLELINFK